LPLSLLSVWKGSGPQKGFCSLRPIILSTGFRPQSPSFWIPIGLLHFGSQISHLPQKGKDKASEVYGVSRLILGAPALQGTIFCFCFFCPVKSFLKAPKSGLQDILPKEKR